MGIVEIGLLGLVVVPMFMTGQFRVGVGEIRSGTGPCKGIHHLGPGACCVIACRPLRIVLIGVGNGVKGNISLIGNGGAARVNVLTRVRKTLIRICFHLMVHIGGGRRVRMTVSLVGNGLAGHHKNCRNVIWPNTERCRRLT